MEIQEFVQDKVKGRLGSEKDLAKMPVSMTTERLNSKALQSEEDMEESLSERVFDTPL